MSGTHESARWSIGPHGLQGLRFLAWCRIPWPIAGGPCTTSAFLPLGSCAMPELYQYEYDSDPDDSSSDYMEPHDPTPEEQEEMRPEDLQRLSHRRMLRRKWDRGTAHRLPLIQEMLDWLNISAKRLGSDDEGDLEDVVIRDDVGYLSLAVRNEQVREQERAGERCACGLPKEGEGPPLMQSWSECWDAGMGI